MENEIRKIVEMIKSSQGNIDMKYLCCASAAKVKTKIAEIFARQTVHCVTVLRRDNISHLFAGEDPNHIGGEVIYK